MTSYHQTKIKKIRNNIKTEIFSSHVNKYKNIHSIKVFIKHNIGHS
jgi:hypothetical protein